MKKLFFSIISLLYLSFPASASAHEAYVLPKEDFEKGLMQTTVNPMAPLLDPANIGLSIQIGIPVAIAFALVILWSTTKPAALLDKLVRKAAPLAPVFIRLAIAGAFFEGAKHYAIFGPELSLSAIPGGDIIHIQLYILAFALFLGVFVEVAGLIGMVIFLYFTSHYGIYMLNYINYFAEFLVLILFGSRFLSVDRLLFGKKLMFKSFEKFAHLETPIVRILYGVAIMYAAYSIKFLHQDIPVQVFNQYNLGQFFPMEAHFVAAGAGMSELTIGLLIVLGLAMRFTILISLVFFVLSLMYFGEMVWPHYILFGISFCLLINSADKFTVDRYLIPFIRKMRKKILHI